MDEEKKMPSLYDKLNMSPPQEVLPAEIQANSSIDQDFETVQKNLQDVIEIGKKSLDDIADIATQSQDAEAYATVASMINSVVAANRELLDAHRRKQIFKKNEFGNEPTAGNTNNLNVSITTAALMELIKKNG